MSIFTILQFTIYQLKNNLYDSYVTNVVKNKYQFRLEIFQIKNRV